MIVALTVNGRARRVDVEERRLLSDLLRHDLGLRGTHVGCEHGVCGACTVLIDGVATRSCLILAGQVEGCDVRTVEALAEPDGQLAPLQAAFKARHGLQCGFCTPGILATATEALERGELTSRAAITDLLSGHLCRCTGYVGIVDAIAEAAGLPPEEHV